MIDKVKKYSSPGFSPEKETLLVFIAHMFWSNGQYFRGYSLRYFGAKIWKGCSKIIGDTSSHSPEICSHATAASRLQYCVNLAHPEN